MGTAPKIFEDFAWALLTKQSPTFCDDNVGTEVSRFDSPVAPNRCFIGVAGFLANNAGGCDG